jgi:hypothetical protein
MSLQSSLFEATWECSASQQQRYRLRIGLGGVDEARAAQALVVILFTDAFLASCEKKIFVIGDEHELRRQNAEF